MVAELTDIPVANAERKRLTADPEQFVPSVKQKNRPKWIQTATREPTYSVLDANDRSIDNDILFGQRSNVVVISAVKSDKTRRLDDLEISRIERREVPNVWLPTVNNHRLTCENSTILEAEDEDPLYSVVKKPKKVQLPDTGFLKESKLQPIGEQSSGERRIQICSRQEELRRWLQVASTRLPEPRRLFGFRDMYTSQLGKLDQMEDWKGAAVAVPRGIVGLVGPYRVYQNPNERREYMLQEEELVEEVVDSVSEIAASGNNGVTEHHRRAKWRIRDEDDEETLVSDIRNIPGLEEFAVEGSKKLADWKKVDDQVVIDYSKNDEEFKPKEDELEGDIASGKEERAVDVPEVASTVSTTSVKDKKGERVSYSVPLMESCLFSDTFNREKSLMIFQTIRRVEGSIW